MIGVSTLHPPSLSPDQRHLLVDELWGGIKAILEDIDLAAEEKNDLLLELGKCSTAAVQASGVSLRALSIHTAPSGDDIFAPFSLD